MLYINKVRNIIRANTDGGSYIDLYELHLLSYARKMIIEHGSGKSVTFDLEEMATIFNYPFVEYKVVLGAAVERLFNCKILFNSLNVEAHWITGMPSEFGATKFSLYFGDLAYDLLQQDD